MPLNFETPMDRRDEPEEEQPRNGFYLYSTEPLEVLFPENDDEGVTRRYHYPDRPLQPNFVPHEDIDRLQALIANAPRREDFPPFLTAAQTRRRHWWGLGADCCYIVLKAGTYLMACWVIAMGLPLMFLLLLCMGQLDMAFLFLGSLFGAFVDATPDRQYAFAHQASWVLVALATAVAAWRLPRFLDEVSKGLNTWRKVS